MLEILQFIFQSFWTWSGTVVLILSFGSLVPSVRWNRVYTKKDPS